MQADGETRFYEVLNDTTQYLISKESLIADVQ